MRGVGVPLFPDLLILRREAKPSLEGRTPPLCASRHINKVAPTIVRTSRLAPGAGTSG